MCLRIHGIPQVISTTALLLCLAYLCSEGGCATRDNVKVTESEKTWRCDEKADNAMKQHEYGKAISLHQRLVEKEPANGLALYHLGYSYGQTGDHLREVRCYEKAVGLGFRKDHIFLNLGLAYGELDQLENAIGAFDKALEINPGNADAHFGLALARYRGLADTLAEEEFLRTIEIDPAHLDARLYLSMLYADRGELQKACEQLRNILEIDPTHIRAREFLERIERE
jgi:tetratricopeptide (TPR) repeat protein